MKSVRFLIHDLNPWGGQDRSTLEVINRIDPSWKISICCYSIQGLKRIGARVVEVKPRIKRPVFFKSLYFQLSTLPFVWMGRIAGEVVHATGACAFSANKIQVQFIHHGWDELLKKHPELRQKSGWVKKIYNGVLHSYNLLSEWVLYRSGKDYLALSKRVKDDLVRFFSIPPERIRVIPHGVDSVIFSPVHDLKKIELKKELLTFIHPALPTDQIILFVGEYQRKGLESSIRAFGAIPSKIRQGWVLIAVGGGSQEYFAGIAESLGISLQVVLVGHRQDILPFYQMSDVFLLPTHYEPFGLVVSEAMSCGLPSIVSRCAGAYELATEGESVIGISEPGNIQEITGHLQSLIENPELRVKLSRAGREVAVSRNWDRVAHEYENWLQT